MAAWILLSGGPAWGGGSGLNVVVVVNQNSSNSVALGNYYRELRGVPPQNVFRISWAGGNTDWSQSAFETTLRAPLASFLAGARLTNQVDFLVLSMDIPYRVTNSTTIDSTTSALFYGFKNNSTPPPGAPASCSLPPASSNAYAGTERAFRSIAPGSLGYTNLLATMITSSNLPLAQQIVYQGALSDGTFPTQTVFLAKSTDYDRNIRFPLFDDAVFDARVRGGYAIQRTNANSIFALGHLLGFQSGSYSYGVVNASFAPGALADNLTSYGGLLFQYSAGQLNILSLLGAGAAGTYGTVDEPCAYLEKFPSPRIYFYQARGFSLAECYYLGITNPYQGLVMGDPLAAPFARPATGAWLNLTEDAVLTGNVPIQVEFSSGGDASRPIQQMDLFVDGLWNRTLTNLPPGRSNVLTVTLNGHTMNYLVPLNASLTSVAGGLAALLNTAANTNATKVMAFARGDRVELQSFDPARPAGATTLAVTSTQGSASLLCTFLGASRPVFLESPAWGWRSFSLTGQPANNHYAQLVITKTNGTQILVGVTNTSGLTLHQMALALVDQINTNAALQEPDGLVAEDLQTNLVSTSPQVEFTLRARAAGWDAARIQADLNASAALSPSPSAVVTLAENLRDLRPRNHLYVSAGLTQFPLGFNLDTSPLADGYHELAVVAYEGSHVRTQTRISRRVRVQNRPLSASFSLLSGASNTFIHVPLQFSIVANTNNVANIELFSTGGLLTNLTGQSSALFTIAGSRLGPGLHPFYAIVTAATGWRYQTETRWIRLVSPPFGEAPFPIALTRPPVTLSWPATAGRTYEILSAPDLGQAFQVRDSRTPTNSPATWTETAPLDGRRIYRVRTAN
ncbi:MAG TPA: TIGR03790 family protein [Verrucomicrobiota bacterium]|nr:TIGR03790 family protein [Verrucomicrobiota bacterium]